MLFSGKRDGRTGYKTSIPRSNQMPRGGPSSTKMSAAMLEDKVTNALDWLRNAKDKFRSFATGEERPATERPRVGLALAGGFARGIAHVGVIRALVDAEIPIDCVAGTSVGALIGACYCAGVPLDEMQRIASTTSFADFGRWTPSWLGLATNQRMENYFSRFTRVKTFEELKTPLAIAATDINAGVSVYYTKGLIAPVLRGSCAYPGLFVPIQFEGRTLVDGFLTAPVPVEGTLLLGADVIIAIHLEPGNLEDPRTVADVISRSFTIIQRHGDIAWRQQADVIIEPDVKPFVWDDFTRTKELVAVGEAAVKDALPEIRAVLSGEKREPAA
jgi:NTE family protein